MPYNRLAVEWSDQHFDQGYRSTWWPNELPTLIVAGADDRIVSQAGWDDPRFAGNNVICRTIPGRDHFPWIENPTAVRAAFALLAERILTLARE